MDEVEDTLVDLIQHNTLTGAVLDNVLAEIRREIETHLPKREQHIAALEAELPRPARSSVASRERSRWPTTSASGLGAGARLGAHPARESSDRREPQAA